MQVPLTGVTVTVPVAVVLLGALAVKLGILPVPDAPNPMAVLLFVQLKTPPPVPVKFTLSVCPIHACTFETALTEGVAVTVMGNVWAGPAQIPCGVTVIVAVPLVLAAVAAIEPVPLAATPMAGLLFVQA